MTTFLGFDFGTAKIGVAVGQSITGTATPLVTLRTVQQHTDWRRIGELIAAWQPAELVVGLPCDIDGRETDIAAPAKRFARQLEGRYRLQVHMVDERLTSMEARRHLRRRPRNIEELDAIAAGLILETWFSIAVSQPSE